jgi:hypothetical protein
MYKGAVEGQIVYVASDAWGWAGRKPAVFKQYFKDAKYLTHPNMAYVQLVGSALVTPHQIKNIFKNDLNN